MSYLDSAGLTRVWQNIKSLLNSKVDKIDGMGLSEANYTIEEKESLSGLGTAMDLFIDFGDLVVSQGNLVIGSNEETMSMFNTKIVTNEEASIKEQEMLLNLIDTIQGALYKANEYTDDRFNNTSVATSTNNGFMSATDKSRLDELWNAWSKVNFLTVAKE